MGFLPAAPQPLVSQFSLLRERRRDGDSPSSSSPPPPPLRPRPFQTPLRRHRRVRNLPRSFPPPISPTLPYALDSERLLRLRFAAEGSSSRNRIVELLALGIGTPFDMLHSREQIRRPSIVSLIPGSKLQVWMRHLLIFLKKGAEAHR
uniref:Uncharacterized protein n=1 Tax=Leersia perrieri TaxID=77586 RepID=A0A0D9VDV6_9ORYZ